MGGEEDVEGAVVEVDVEEEDGRKASAISSAVKPLRSRKATRWLRGASATFGSARKRRAVATRSSLMAARRTGNDFYHFHLIHSGIIHYEVIFRWLLIMLLILVSGAV